MGIQDIRRLLFHSLGTVPHSPRHIPRSAQDRIHQHPPITRPLHPDQLIHLVLLKRRINSHPAAAAPARLAHAHVAARVHPMRVLRAADGRARARARVLRAGDERPARARARGERPARVRAQRRELHREQEGRRAEHHGCGEREAGLDDPVCGVDVPLDDHAGERAGHRAHAPRRSVVCECGVSREAAAPATAAVVTFVLIYPQNKLYMSFSLLLASLSAIESLAFI